MASARVTSLRKWGLPRLAVVLLTALSLFTAARADDPLPTPWNGMDIGSLSPAGAATANSGTFTLTGGEGRLSGTADQFHFVYQSLTGDCALIARVTAGADANGLVAGVMARQALATNSDYVALALTPGHGVTATSRIPFVPQTASEGVSAASPTWLKLVKRGTGVQPYVAADAGGAPGAWKPLGGHHPIPSGMIYVGLYLAGRTGGGTATFDHVSLLTGSQPAFDDGVYVISPAGAPGMALTAAPSGIKLAPSTASAIQKWRLVNKGGGLYALQTTFASPLGLSVPGRKSDSGAPVAVAAEGEQAPLWSVVANPNDTYGLRPQFNPGIGLDDFGGNGTPDAVIDVWSYDPNDPHLQWLITPAP